MDNMKRILVAFKFMDSMEFMYESWAFYSSQAYRQSEAPLNVLLLPDFKIYLHFYMFYYLVQSYEIDYFVTCYSGGLTLFFD
jgi:hypothetical protein